MDERKGIKEMFLDAEWSKLRWWEFGPFVAYYVVFFAVRDLIRERGTVLTASLAFATALAVVPLLSVALSVLLTAGSMDGGAALEPYIQQLFPSAAGGIVIYLTEFAKTSASEVAGVGALTFFAIAFFLFVAIERAFNIIWRSHRKRPLARKLGAFAALMVLGPVALSLSFGMTGYAAIQAEQFNVSPGFVLVLMPFLLGFAVFWGMNHFLPTARVHPAFSGLAGAFTAVAFELGKTGFNLYVTELILVPYNQVYGTLGLFPLFLIWLYVIWIIVLIGASLAYTAQNLRTLVRVERASQLGSGRAGDHVFAPTIGLELYAPIASAFKSGEGRMSDRDLVAVTGYAEHVVRAAVEELEKIGALEIVEDEEGDRRLLPAKQLEDIELWPMLDVFFEFESDTKAEPVRDLLRRYKTASLDVLTGQNALALVPGDIVAAARAEAARRRQPTPAPVVRTPEPDPLPPLAEPSSPSIDSGGAPLVDADVFESPPDMSFDLADAQGPTLDAQLRRARAIADRAKSLKTQREEPLSERTSAAPGPMAALVDATDEHTVVEDSDDGIRIHTQDILVEEEEMIEAAEPTAADLLKQVMSSKSPKKKAKEPSIEIDIAGMWDDFEVDSYDEMLAQASSEVTRDPDPAELGDERSSPPPMPDKN